MEIKSRIIPAKPRNKELYFLKGTGGTVISSSSGTSNYSPPTYWELVTEDNEGNPLAEPYLKTKYSAISEKEITAYGVGASESDTGVSALYQLSDVDPSVENAPENSILKKIGTHWKAVSGDLQPLLVSGTNIATINGQNLLNGGNILIEAGSSGSVTSVGLTVPTGLSVTGSPITDSGTLAISLASGYSIPTTAKQNEWDTAYSNYHTHSNKTVIDGITSTNITNWGTAYTNSHSHTNKTVLDGIDSTKVSNWNNAYTNSHSHTNKAIIDSLTQSNIDVLSKLSIDANGNLKIDTNAYSTGELSAYGVGTGGGSGTAYERLDSWADYAAGKEGWVLSALLGKDLDTRVSTNNTNISTLTSKVNAIENGSATSVVVTGTGNAITDISKSGTTITATKGLTFAELDASGKVLASQLPSYVDDVLSYINQSIFPTIGESGKIYIAEDTNKTYRWAGGYYVEISPSIALGETSSTAYRGDRGKIAYDHTFTEHQTIINGTGFVKANGKTLSYDNSSYSLSNHNHNGVYEPVFSKNTAFNKNFGTTSGTVAQGNDSRIINGQTAYNWGDHSSAGYALAIRNITAGNGLTGGGDLSSNRTLTLGTPSNITATSTNSVTATSHTHNLVMGSGSGLDADLLDGNQGSYYTGYADTAINAIVTGPRNYVISSRTDNLTGWSTINGTRSIINDVKFGNVVQWARTSGSPADWQKQFTLAEKSSFEGGPITLFVIAKQVSASGFFYFGWNGSTTFINTNSSNTNQIDLGGGWFVFWRSGTGPASLTSSTYFGINTLSGTWQFYAVGLNIANKYGGWQSAQEDMVTLNTAQTITGEKTFTSEVFGSNGFRVNDPSMTGVGISLYYNSPATNPSYGLMFATTASKGTHGSVTGTHATYFTMNVTAGRGWIFTTDPVGTTGNVASISNTGNITASGEITAYVASDRRLKENITPIPSALDYINRLNPVTYNWNAKARELNSSKTNDLDYGLIAQEVEEVLPNIVHGIFDDKYKSIDYIKLIPIMISAIKELKYEINNLKK